MGKPVAKSGDIVTVLETSRVFVKNRNFFWTFWVEGMSYSLSFTKGKDSEAVAVVRNGPYDGEILYLHDNEAKKERPEPKKEFSPTKYLSQMKGMKPTDRVRLSAKIQEALDKKQEELVGESKEMKELYQQIKRDVEKDKSIELPSDSTYFPIPNPDPNVRSVVYCAGMSGSGKSYFAKNYAENYIKLFPSRSIYLVSQLEHDETLDNLKVNGKVCPPKRLDYKSFVKNPPTMEEFEDPCLIIFDDYDCIADPYGKAVQQMIDMIAIQGRHSGEGKGNGQGTSMLVLSHFLSNYRKTRLILGEAQSMVLYPYSTSYKALQYVCQHHCGLSKEEVQGLKKLGRWVLIKKTYPSYLISAHTAYMLNQ